MLQFSLQKLNNLERWEAQNLWQKNKNSPHFNNGAFFMFYLDYALKISLRKCVMITLLSMLQIEQEESLS